LSGAPLDALASDLLHERICGIGCALMSIKMGIKNILMRRERDRSAEQELSRMPLREDNRTRCLTVNLAGDVTECVHARRCTRIVILTTPMNCARRADQITQIRKNRLCPALLPKIFLFRFSEKYDLLRAVPFPYEGRFAIVTSVGRGMRWT